MANVQFNKMVVYEGNGNYTFLPNTLTVDIIVPDGIGGMYFEHYDFENIEEGYNFVEDVRNLIGAVTTFSK